MNFQSDYDAAPSQYDSPMLLRLHRRRWFILATAIPLFLVLVVAAKMLPAWYKAASEVSVESRTAKSPVLGSGLENTGVFSEDIIGTEIAILGSRELLGQVTNDLKLYNDPHYNPNLQPSRLQFYRDQLSRLFGLIEAHPRRSDPWTDTVETLTNSVDFAPVPRSRVIRITVKSYDPDVASLIANTIARDYITRHTTSTHEMSADANKYLSARLAELQSSATEAQSAVEDYKTQFGLSSGASSTLIREQISQLEHDLLEAITHQATVYNQYVAATKSKSPEDVSMVVNNQTMTRLRDLEATTSSKLSDLSSRYDQNTALLLPLKRQLADVRGKIALEAARAVEGLRNDVVAAAATVATLTEREHDMQTTLSKTEGARAHLDTLQAQANAALNLYTAFLSRSKETDASLMFPATDVRIISAANPPTHPWFPRSIYVVPASAVIAFCLSAMLALLIESRLKGITSSAEAELALQIPTLGLVPLWERRHPIMFRDAIENLYSRLHFGLRAQSILITSPLPHEGKTTIARALAEAGAARGHSVLLIDGDLRSAQARQPEAGFAELLRGEADLNEAIQRTDTNLVVLQSGQVGDNPVRLLSMPSAVGIFKELKTQFDLILVDAPPAVVGGDCWVLARYADQIVLIARWTSTTARALRYTVKLLSAPRDDGDGRMPAKPIGLVLNMVRRSRSLKMDNADSIMFDREVSRYYKRSL
jgi:polysaccharide biosynthesis transport protein